MRTLLLTGAGAVLVLVPALAFHFYTVSDHDARVEVLEQENARLTEALGVRKLALEMERATRAELERQLAQVNDSLKKRQSEVEFFRAQADRKAR